MNHLESSFSGKNAFWRYLLVLLAVLAASNTIGAIPLMISIAKNPEAAAVLTENPNDLSILGLDPGIYLLEMLFPFFVGLAVFVFLIKPLNGRTVTQVINGTSYFRWKRFFISMLVWTIIASIYLFAAMKLDPLNYSLNNKSFTLIPLVVISVLFIPFQATWEEIIFRGYLMQGFSIIFRQRWFPLLMTSILFSMIHIFNPEVKEFGLWEMMPQYLLFGLIFGIITLLDDGIETAMGAHTANNVFLSIMLTNKGSALQTSSVYVQHHVYPWIDLITTFIMGILFILILKKIFRWNSFSVVFAKVEKIPSGNQIL